MWLVMLLMRWSHRSSEVGEDPTPRWLDWFHRVGPAYWLPPLMFLLATPLVAVRLRRRPSERPVPAERAVLAYLVMHLGAYFWMIPWAWASPLAQQYLYSLWVLACLWPLRKTLQWRPQKGWWKWGLCAFGLALLGALIYGFLLHPAPSVNQAVPLLLHSEIREKLLWLGLLCALTPLLEEFWYRGILSGPHRLRLCLSALVFGLVHADPSALPQLVWLGLVFGWARWSGGLAAAVLAHALWNVTVAVYLLGA